MYEHQANSTVSNELQYSFLIKSMALTNTKRKLTEDTHGDRSLHKSQKRQRSNQGESEAEKNPRSKQPIVTDPPTLSADKTLQTTLQKAKNSSTNPSKVPPIQKTTKQHEAFGKISGSSNQAPTVKPSSLAKSKHVFQKQRSSSSGNSSFDEGNLSSADPANAGANATSGTPSNAVWHESDTEDVFEDDEDKEDYDDSDDGAPYSSKELGEKSGPKSNQSEATEAEAEADIETEAFEHFEIDQLSSASDPGSSTESSTERASNATSDSDDEPAPNQRKKEISKADNPSAFASSIANILDYKLTKTQRANPILARSADAKEADETLLDRKLEKKAKAELKKEKSKNVGDVNAGLRGSIEKGTGRMSGDESLEGREIVANQQREKELRKMAQKGVVKMFNAFASVRAKAMEAQSLGGSRAKKEERLTEMSKEGWLEYVGQGGKGKVEDEGKA